MANQSQSSYTESGTFFPWLNPIKAVPRETLTRAREVWLESTRAWQDEMTRFAAQRLLKDSEASRDFLGCTNWSEAAKLHQTWMASAAHDYGELMGRLGQTTVKFGSGMAACSRAAAEEAGEATRSGKGEAHRSAAE